MRRLASAEAHFDLDLVAILQETPRGADANLQIVLIGARPQADLFDLRDVLVLFRVAGALILLEAEPTEVGYATDGRHRGRRDLDQVETGFFGASQRLLDRHDTQLLAVLIEDSNFRNADLVVRSGAGGDRRACIK